MEEKKRRTEADLLKNNFLAASKNNYPKGIKIYFSFILMFSHVLQFKSDRL